METVTNYDGKAARIRGEPYEAHVLAGQEYLISALFVQGNTDGKIFLYNPPKQDGSRSAVEVKNPDSRARVSKLLSALQDAKI